MTEAALRTAQAARFLNISADTLRKLSRLGLIETEQSPGGHARYPLPVLERMKREGIPEIPCEIPAADDNPETERELDQPQRDTVPHGQAMEQPDDDGAPRSDAVIAAEDESMIEEYRARTDETSLKRLRLQFEREEVNDQFRAREQRDRQAQESELARQRAAAAAQEWRAFLKRQLEYALSKLPSDLDGSVQQAILESVLGVLEKLGQDVTEWTARRAVDAQIESGLAPWRERKEIAALIETACGRLPTGMRGHATWRFRAIEAATKALSTLRPEANQFEKQTAVEHAINLVKATFEYLELRELKIKASSLPWEATSEETEAARDSVRQALEALPSGSSVRELEAARDGALAPFRSTIRTRKDRKMREGLIPYWYLNYPGIDAEALKKEIQQAIDAFPEGTPERDLERIRDKIRDKRRREQTDKEALISGGLNQIAAYMQTLRKEWEIPHDLNGPWQAVRECLQQEITHETPAEEVARIVRRRIRRYFRIR